jgi:hypothetical protein
MLRAMLQMFTLQRLLFLLWALTATAPALAAKECETKGTCISVAVTKVVVEGKIDGELAVTLKEGLKSEVRQNDSLKIVLSADNYSLPDLQQLNGCEELTEECLNKITDSLGADALAFASLKKVPGGYSVDLKWYLRKGDHSKALFERQVPDPKRPEEGIVKGDSERKFENEVPKIAFRLFGGDTGTLIITSNIDGAEVMIQGGEFDGTQLAGLTPFQNDRMLVDNYKITVRKREFLTITQDVQINAGQRVEIPVELVPANQGYGPASKALIISGWSVAGTGGAFLVAGLITGIMTNSKQNEFDSKLVSSDLTFDTIDEARTIKDDGNTLSDTTNVLLGVGGGLTVVGLTLLLLGYTEVFDEEEKSGSDLRTTFFIDPNGGGGALMHWRF